MAERSQLADRPGDRVRISCTCLRQQLERGSWLRTSSNGRKAGWWIELEGETVGRLTAPLFEDMFWMSYCIEEARPDILENVELWLQCKLRFRSVATGEYAPHAFASGEVRISLVASRVSMRALYLMPQGRVEEIAFKLPRLAHFLIRLLPKA